MGNAESAPTAAPMGQELSENWDHAASENITPNLHGPQPELLPFSKVLPKGLAPPGKQQRSHHLPTPIDPAEDRGSQDDADSTISALMEASAAVFHYLNIADAESSFDDDVSISDMSAAVFDHLKYEATTGNEAPMRQFLETAQVVSGVLLHERNDRPLPRSRDVQHSNQRKTNRRSANADYSVSEQRAAIFQALERTHGKPEDRNPPSKRPPSRLQLRQVDDSQSVVSEMSQSIFKVLDETKEKINEERVAEFSAIVFDLLDKEKQSEENGIHSAGPLSERSGAIFKVLETKTQDASGASPTRQTEPEADPSPAADATFVSHLKPQTDPRKLMTRNIFHILAQRQKQPFYGIEEEDQEEDHDEEVIPEPHDVKVHTIPLPPEQKLMTVEEIAPQTEQQPYVGKEVDKQMSPREYSDATELAAIFSEEIHADTSDQEIQEEIDLVFVERFEEVFNEFIGMHPKFLLTNPEVVRHLRINKLQKLLEHMDDCESRLLTKLSRTIGEKQTMENQLSRELREASRSKAAYQVQLQSELDAVNQKTSFKQAQTTWKVVSSAEAKAKKEHLHEQAMQRKRDSFFKENFSGIPTREELLQLLPTDAAGKALKAAILATPRFLGAESEQLDEMRQYQVDNAFMSSEIAVLNKKLSYAGAQSKRLAWVDSLLLRLDKVHMANLKNKFTQSLGVVSLD
jgi:hypothetical protein